MSAMSVCECELLGKPIQQATPQGAGLTNLRMLSTGQLDAQQGPPKH